MKGSSDKVRRYNSLSTFKRGWSLSCHFTVLFAISFFVCLFSIYHKTTLKNVSILLFRRPGKTKSLQEFQLLTGEMPIRLEQTVLQADTLKFQEISKL